MKKIIPLIVCLVSTVGLQAQNLDCSDIFISEYVEGWSNNKALELYNPTSQTIDLSNYALSRWSNGGTTPSTTILEGTIEPYDAFVIAIDKRNPDGEGYEAPVWDGWYHFIDSTTLLPDSIYTDEDNLMGRVDLFICPNYEDGTMYFNGNDAVTLETASGDILDVFGKIGEDPGESWEDGTGAYWTKDQTLVRKSTVTSGFVYDPEQPYTFDPTLEWDSLPVNTFVNLGIHDCDCGTFSTIEAETFISIYPNPNTTGELSIQTKNPINSIHVYNILGEYVISKNITSLSMQETIVLKPDLKGMYFVQIQLENKQRIVKKLLIK